MASLYQPLESLHSLSIFVEQLLIVLCLAQAGDVIGLENMSISCMPCSECGSALKVCAPRKTALLPLSTKKFKANFLVTGQLRTKPARLCYQDFSLLNAKRVLSERKHTLDLPTTFYLALRFHRWRFTGFAQLCKYKLSGLAKRLQSSQWKGNSKHTIRHQLRRPRL